MRSQEIFKNPEGERQISEPARSISPSQKTNDLSIALEHARTVLLIVGIVFAISIVILVNQFSDKKTIAAMLRDTERLEESIARIKRVDMKVLEHEITQLRVEIARDKCYAVDEKIKETEK